MDVAAVKQWQWLTAGVAVGLVLFGLHWWNRHDLARFGDPVNDPARFERALTTKVAGISALKDLTVYRQRLDDGAGASKEVHVVTGRFCDGEIDPRDGKYHWRRSVFIAPVPYRPVSDLAAVAGAPAALRHESTEAPTVVDLLDVVEESHGVEYTHAWWNTYPALTRLGGSVLLIGVVWPTAINLLVYGSFFRPREEKGVDLSKVSPATGRPPAARELSLEELRRLEEGLADQVAGAGEAMLTAPPATAALTAEALNATAPTAREHAEFGARPDDFYPTERAAAKPKARPKSKVPLNGEPA